MSSEFSDISMFNTGDEVIFVAGDRWGNSGYIRARHKYSGVIDTVSKYIRNILPLEPKKQVSNEPRDCAQIDEIRWVASIELKAPKLWKGFQEATNII